VVRRGRACGPGCVHGAQRRSIDDESGGWASLFRGISESLARERDKRYASAREFGKDLWDFLFRFSRSVSAYDIAELLWSGMVDGDPAPLVAHASPAIDHDLDALTAAWDPAERARLAPALVAGLAETWPIAGIVADAPQGLIAKRVRGARDWDGWIDLTQLSLAP